MTSTIPPTGTTPPTRTAPPATAEEYITFLAGRFSDLQDSYTVSGITTSRKFNSYVYTRKLLIRKSLEDDPAHYKIHCTHCTKGMWIVSASSTSSSLQLRHIRHRHPSLPTSQDEETQYLNQFQLEKRATNTPFSIARGNAIATRKPVDRFDNKILREHISCFLVNTNASLSVVENPSFQQLLQYCNPTAIMISQRTAARDIQNLYIKLQPRIQAMLQEFTSIQQGRVSLTLDAWTSATQIPFLGITCHYIEPLTWKHQSLLLGFERLRGSHSAQALGGVVITVLNKFNISGAIRAITADSASVNTAMFRNLEKGGFLSGFRQQDCHVRCMGHVINLAVQVLLKGLRTTAIKDEAKLVDEDIEDSSSEGMLSIQTILYMRLIY